MSNIIIENRKIAHNITPKSYIKNLKNKIDETKISLKSINNMLENNNYKAILINESKLAIREIWE